MIECPCGYGKNIKDDQPKCPVCGMDLTPIHRLRKAGEAVSAMRIAASESERTVLEQKKQLTEQKNKLRTLGRLFWGAAALALIAAAFSVFALFKPARPLDASTESPAPATPEAAVVIEARLAGYATLNGLDITLSENADAVVVSGEVHSGELRSFVIDIVTNEAGGKQIIADSLIVREPETAFPELAEALKTAYAGCADLEDASLEVSAGADGISVSGTLPGEVYRNLAIAIAERYVDAKSLDFSGLTVEAPPAPSPEVLPFFTYTVKPGDSLAKIAYLFYGDNMMWTRIYDANRENILDANNISVGQVLKIPPG